MNSLAEAMPTAYYADGRIFVMLPHGINLSFPVEGNWRLEAASPNQLNDMELDDEGIHWPSLDEDLSYEGLLRGDYGQFVRRPARMHSTNRQFSENGRVEV